MLNKFYSSWYCSRNSQARSLLTAVVPPLLLMLWQNLVMPNALYRFAWVSASCVAFQTLPSDAVMQFCAG